MVLSLLVTYENIICRFKSFKPVVTLNFENQQRVFCVPIPSVHITDSVKYRKLSFALVRFVHVFEL